MQVDQPQRTARDQRYIESTSFEVYMVVGTVFVLGFSAIFILTVLTHTEPLLWPGSALLVGLCYFVLTLLERNERVAKIREVDGEPVR